MYASASRPAEESNHTWDIYKLLFCVFGALIVHQFKEPGVFLLKPLTSHFILVPPPTPSVTTINLSLHSFQTVKHLLPTRRRASPALLELWKISPTQYSHPKAHCFKPRSITSFPSCHYPQPSLVKKTSPISQIHNSLRQQTTGVFFFDSALQRDRIGDGDKK